VRKKGRFEKSWDRRHPACLVQARSLQTRSRQDACDPELCISLERVLKHEKIFSERGKVRKGEKGKRNFE